MGKAAHQMACTGVDVLARARVEPVGGLVVAPELTPSPHRAIEVVVGDHPVPREASRAAAHRLQILTSRVRPGDEASGCCSPAADPVCSPHRCTMRSRAADITTLGRLLYERGLDIAEMNVVRKRFARWGAGRLARALAHAGAVRVMIVSDVVGDDISVIASGPCAPDASSAADVRALLSANALWDDLPTSLQHALMAAERDARLETLKPGDAAFTRVESDDRG